MVLKIYATRDPVLEGPKILVPQLTTKTHKNLIEIGPYGSPWVHIERIRSHRPYKGFKIPKIDLVCNIRLNMSLDVGRGMFF